MYNRHTVNVAVVLIFRLTKYLVGITSQLALNGGLKIRS